jgi:predicted metal-dependent hydrolase
VARAKQLRITVASKDGVTVTGPRRISYKTLEHFFIERSAWVLQQLEHFEARPSKSLALPQEMYQQKKEAAQKQVEKKLAQWNTVYQFSWKRVTIRNQKTRWGSCSSRGNLSFHARIIDLPEELQDYLIVHELCHLQEMNHGPRFWKLVSQGIPGAQHLKKKLSSTILEE